MTTLYNINTRSAYQAGHYDGIRTIAEMQTRTDFALGALDHNDGELVVLNGTAWRSRADGGTSPVDPNVSTPYATGLTFTPDNSVAVDSPLHQDDLASLLAPHISLADRIWAIKITGQFSTVTAGAGDRQQPPYRPLAEVFAEYHLHTHHNTRGTLVGFHCPIQLTGTNVVGLHVHYLAADHAHGGHATGWILERGVIDLCRADSYHVDLPADTAPTGNLRPYYR